MASQQVSLLTATKDPITNPRTAFRRDLRIMLAEYKEKGYLIILMGDFNEPFGSDPDGITKVAADIGLIDIMRRRHSSTPPATYARGSTRLDYILTSPEVWDSVCATGYDEFNSRIPSDHRGFFLDLDTAILFGSETQALASIPRRGLETRNIHQMTEYIRHKHKLFTEHNVFKGAEQLLVHGNRHALAERLDVAVLEASLLAETRVQRVGESEWSVELAHARRTVSVLTKQLSALRNRYDISPTVLDELKHLDPIVVLPTSVQECSKALRAAKARVKEIELTVTNIATRSGNGRLNR